MMMHHGILCIGSNIDCEANAFVARNELKQLFPFLRWARPRWTEPVNFINSALFLDQVAEFSTTLSANEVCACFKDIERKCGRSPEDKTHGIVKMDIDLLVFDEKILKAEDWQREYVRQSIEEFSLSI